MNECRWVGTTLLGALSLRACPRLVALASARQWRRRRREEEEEEGLFNANAVNVEGSKRDRATLVWRRMNVRICCSLPGQRGSMVLGAGLECPATSLCDSVLRPLPSDSFAACQQNLLLFLLLFPLSLSCCLRFSGAREAQRPERQSPAQARDRE